MEKYDTIILGTGTAGQSAGYELVAEGFSVAIVEESDTPGGICALRGCQAKKYFYELTETVARAEHLLGRGISSPPMGNWKQILEHKNSFTETIPESTVASLRGNGITYIQGSAHFLDTNIIGIGDRRIEADHILIATGSIPRRLRFEGSEHLATSDDFLDLEELPERIVFLGGGFISLEFAHFSARLGSRPGHIHIFEAENHLLRPFDRDLVAQLIHASSAAGINTHTGVGVEAIRPNGKGFLVSLTNGESVETDLVVNGTGREPNIDRLSLESAGVEYTTGGILVNRSMQTSIPNIFAIGDCVASIQLARVADQEALIAARSISAIIHDESPPEIDYSGVPSILFTYPQLGMVGKTEQQLQQEKIRYWKSGEMNLGWPTYRRIGMNSAAYKILIGEEETILGAHVLSDNATGLINTFKEAILHNIPVAELHASHIMAPYPSRESDILYMLAPLVE